MSPVLYEGKPVGTPDACALWRVISEHQVRGFFTAPTALRAVRKEDPDLLLLKDYDISCLRCAELRLNVRVFSAPESVEVSQTI